MSALPHSTSLVGEMADEVAACLADYDLIPPGAKIGVALSGGLDSWAVAALLAELVAAGRIDAHLTALHVELGHPGSQDRLQALLEGCRAASVPLVVHHSTIGPESVADGGKRPCFLCARRRRQALYELADSLEITHIATGHHRDDVLASFLLNLLENREISTLMPAQPVFDGRFVLIRPLYALPKDRLAKLHRQQEFPVQPSGCPIDGATRRSELASWLEEIEESRPGTKDALFQALHRAKPDFLPRRR
ncbi:MAG: ATP-binding protein [Candidatus Lernaella stagnicola]|nr:ATP-binding protein [Candidatus Lernaella stagnicola]